MEGGDNRLWRATSKVIDQNLAVFAFADGQAGIAVVVRWTLGHAIPAMPPTAQKVSEFGRVHSALPRNGSGLPVILAKSIKTCEAEAPRHRKCGVRLPLSVGADFVPSCLRNLTLSVSDRAAGPSH